MAAMSYESLLNLYNKNYEVFLPALSNYLTELTINNADQQVYDLCVKLSELNSQDPNFWITIANCLPGIRQYEAAIDAWQRAIDLHPDPRLYYYQSKCVLITGNLEKGFALHEHRIAPFLNFHPKEKIWKGESILGKTLLVHFHGGLGDAIQFGRYIPFLKKYNRVILQIPSELHCIFEHLDVPMFSFFKSSFQNAPLTYDHVVFNDSLPYCFKTDSSNIPPPMPIKMNYRPIQGRIGIVWNTTSEFYPPKSMHLSQLIPLLNLPDKHFVCLQKEVSIEEDQLLKEYGVERPLLETFADTVKILQRCELVISIDSSVAHLSGSMGIPTWVFIPFLPCWRWGSSQNHSPWYPSMRLFRQQNRTNDWSELVKEIKLNLSKKIIR